MYEYLYKRTGTQKRGDALDRAEEAIILNNFDALTTAGDDIASLSLQRSYFLDLLIIIADRLATHPQYQTNAAKLLIHVANKSSKDGLKRNKALGKILALASLLSNDPIGHASQNQTLLWECSAQQQAYISVGNNPEADNNQQRLATVGLIKSIESIGDKSLRVALFINALLLSRPNGTFFNKALECLIINIEKSSDHIMCYTGCCVAASNMPPHHPMRHKVDTGLSRHGSFVRHKATLIMNTSTIFNLGSHADQKVILGDRNIHTKPAIPSQQKTARLVNRLSNK